jgi:hypothetical protein
MTPIRKLYSPDPFDDLIKAKLNEVEVDASLADKYWQPMKDSSSQNLSGKIFFKYWLSAFVLVVILFLLIRMVSGTSDVSPEANNNEQVQQNNSHPLEKDSITKTETVKSTMPQKSSKYSASIVTDVSNKRNLGIPDSAYALAQPIPADVSDSVVKKDNVQITVKPPIDSIKRVDSITSKPQQQTKKRKPSFIIW